VAKRRVSRVKTDRQLGESFFATLECELLDRHRFRTRAEARIAVFEFIEGFYNPRRRRRPGLPIPGSACSLATPLPVWTAAGDTVT
jgi:transposase InsO family protein